MKYYNIRHSELCNNRFLWLWSRQMMTAKYLTFSYTALQMSEVC